MAGVQDPQTVDVVASDPSSEGCLLVMVEDRPWGSDPKQAVQLREKINTYAGFVLDGALERQFPEVAGQPVRIQLRCLQEPRGEFAAVLEHAGTKLAALGLGFDIQLQPEGPGDNGHG